MSKAARVIRKIAGNEAIPFAVVLGSGLAPLAEAVCDRIIIPYSELRGFPKGGVSGHGSDLVIGRLGGKRVAVLTGREHYYEHGNPAAMRPALEALAEIGVGTLLLTNSAGSLEPATGPGGLMLIADHINYSGLNPLIGIEGDRRFVNMVDAYDPELRRLSHGVAERLGIALSEGIYMWYSGPSFETPAEIRMAIRLGGNAVGMSTVPEVIVARMLGLRVWACSAVTNLGAGMSEAAISHEETKRVAKMGAEKLGRLIPALLEEL